MAQPDEDLGKNTDESHSVIGNIQQIVANSGQHSTSTKDIEVATNLLGLANAEFIVIELQTEVNDGKEDTSEQFRVATMSDPNTRDGKQIVACDKDNQKGGSGSLHYLGIQQPGEPVQRFIEVELMEISADGSEDASLQEIEHAARNFQEIQSSPAVAISSVDSSELIKDPDSGLFPCKTCGRTFAIKSALATHLLTHPELRSYVCPTPDCDKSFRTKDACKRHNASHTGMKPFECDDCHKKFASTQGLKEHISIHQNTKLYKCSECGKEFRQVSSLCRHQTVHSIVKRFSCLICSKSFKQATYLRSHMKSHTGERPYRCDICHKLYAHRSDLNRHKIIHTGEKPYQCDLCGHSFADSSSRRRHVRDHDELRGTYICHICNQYFRRFGLLKTHLSRRHNIIEVEKADDNTLKIIGSDSIDLHEPSDNTPRAKYIQRQLLRVLFQLRKAKPNSQYKFVSPQNDTMVSDLLDATRHFRDSATGVTVEEQDLAVHLAMNALQAEQNENVVVCEQEVPLTQEGSVYLTHVPETMVSGNRIEVVNEKGDIEYYEITMEEMNVGETGAVNEPVDIKVESTETPKEINADETQQVDVVEIDENLFQMHYDQQPELGSDEFGLWLSTFIELCKCWEMPLQVEHYGKLTRVHKTMIDALAAPKGKLAEKENFEFLSGLSGVLGGLITQHLAAVLTNLK